MPGRAVVNAAAALVGVTIPEDDEPPRIQNLTVQISGAAAVIAPPPLERVTIPVKREPDIPMEWTATERLPPTNHRQRRWRGGVGLLVCLLLRR